MDSKVLLITVRNGIERESDVLQRARKVYASLQDKMTPYAQGVLRLINLHEEVLSVYKKYDTP